jgi:hypothetical protein
MGELPLQEYRNKSLEGKTDFRRVDWFIRSFMSFEGILKIFPSITKFQFFPSTWSVDWRHAITTKRRVLQRSQCYDHNSLRRRSLFAKKLLPSFSKSNAMVTVAAFPSRKRQNWAGVFGAENHNIGPRKRRRAGRGTKGIVITTGRPRGGGSRWGWPSSRSTGADFIKQFRPELTDKTWNSYKCKFVVTLDLGAAPGIKQKACFMLVLYKYWTDKMATKKLSIARQ